MASPTYRSGSIGFVAGSTTAFLDVPLPTGHAANDILVVDIYCETDTAFVSTAGFTQLTVAENNSAGEEHRHYMFWKRDTGAETDPAAFILGASVWCAAVTYAISGCVTSGTPYNTSAQAVATAATQTADLALTTTVTDTLLVHAALSYDGGTWTPPAGFTQAGEPITVEISYLAQSSAGATGEIKGTISVADSISCISVAFTSTTSVVPPAPDTSSHPDPIWTPITITPGYNFTEHETLSPAKLNALVDDATVTGLGATNFAGVNNNLGILTYGNTAPPLSRGALWYNTTTGAEGLYWAFLSASNASVSGWLCATPRRDMYAWAQTSFSMGTPVYVGRQGNADLGHHVITYDGTLFPLVWPAAAATGAHPQLVVPLSNVSASGPVRCAWAGFVQLLMGNSPVGAAGKEIGALHAGGTTFRDDDNSSQNNFGVGSLVSGGTFTTAPAIFWGASNYEKFV